MSDLPLPDAAPGLLTLRPGRAEDAETLHAALIELSLHLDAAHNLKSSAGDLRRHGFGDHPKFDTLIAEIDGVFAGMCTSFPSFSTWIGRPGVYVQDLFVAEPFRGRGVGEVLLGEVARASGSRGGAYLRLSVDIANVTAQQFYARLGIAHSTYEQVHSVRGDAFLRLAGMAPT